MAEVAIPEPFRHALIALEELDDAAADGLIHALEEAPEFQRVADLREPVRQAFGEGRRPDADRVLPAILSLRGSARTMSAERLAQLASDSAELGLEPEGRARLA